MERCLIREDSLRFSMVVYGTLALIAFLLDNFWIVLIVGILMGLGAISINYNLFYQLHSLLLLKLLTKKPSPPSKDINEARFAGFIAATFLFLAFLLFYFWKLKTLAWILTGIVILLSLLAGISGICVGSLMYVFFKKILKK
jgi:hypothetical protein